MRNRHVAELPPPVDPYPAADWVPPEHPPQTPGWNTVTHNYANLSGPEFTDKEWDLLDKANKRPPEAAAPAAPAQRQLANTQPNSIDDPTRHRAPVSRVVDAPTRQMPHVMPPVLPARERFPIGHQRQPRHASPDVAPDIPHDPRHMVTVPIQMPAEQPNWANQPTVVQHAVPTRRP